MMQKNDTFEGKVLDLTHEGLGVVKQGGFPFFVENALPNELVKLRVTKIGKTFGYARVEEFLTQSEERVMLENSDLLRTGIADLAHLAYPAQLAFKQRQVATVLSKAGIDIALQSVLAAERITAYRNKAQIPVRLRDGQLTTGFFRKNSHELVAIENFYIQQPEIDALILAVRDWLRQSRLTAYDEHEGSGLVRNMVIRRASATGEMMLVLVLSKSVKLDFSALLQAFPQLVSVQYSIKSDAGNAIFGKEFELIEGQDFITDRLLGKEFQIAAQSFYQVNSRQAEHLYEKAYELADFRPSDLLIDCYSGIGTIGLCAAERVAQVYGMDVVAEAVENAKTNAALNACAKAQYEVGSAEAVLPRWLAEGIQPDVIFVDPPRKGLEESFIHAAAAAHPRSIVYISCNPATFARDAVRFGEVGYELLAVQPVDLFPQTHHIELVAKLIRKESKKGKREN